jgi:hypothetical protein
MEGGLYDVLMRPYGVLITCLASPKSTMQKAEEDLSRLTKLAVRIVKKLRECEKLE